MTNILFSVKTNVLGLNGITFSNKPLLFPYNTCININDLPFFFYFVEPTLYVLMDRGQFHCDLITVQCLGIWWIPKHCKLLKKMLWLYCQWGHKWNWLNTTKIGNPFWIVMLSQITFQLSVGKVPSSCSLVIVVTVDCTYNWETYMVQNAL